MRYTIERAWGMTKDGRDKQVGWDVFCNGHWGNRYHYLRDAKAAVREAEREDAKR